jgi:AcrR family transcriptional regulator
MGQAEVDATAPGPRDRLLQATLRYVREHGVGDLSLRQLAAAIGTSHRMLLYHFGSKEGLLVEVIRAVEAEQLEALAQLAADETLSPTELMRRMAARLTDRSLWPNERLFFEVYGQALQRRAGTEELLPGVVTSWLEPLTELGVRHGVAADEAPAHARVLLALGRGLLLDLLATGDADGVGAASDYFFDRYERLFAG